MIVDSSKGVIVGADRKQEWMLPWWWLHYRQNNDYPVTFFDFGDLSLEARHWCASRGEVRTLDLELNFLAKKETVSQELVHTWEKAHPQVWELRNEWFKKPVACLQSPYDTTLWLDVDTQVRGTVESLFAFCDNPGGLAIAKEPARSQEFNLRSGMIPPGQTIYNAGVIAFQKQSPLIQSWIQQTQTHNQRYCSDQQLLSDILSTTVLAFYTLPSSYNWTPDLGKPKEQIILQWWGSIGKSIIKKQIEFLTKQLFIELTFQTR